MSTDELTAELNRKTVQEKERRDRHQEEETRLAQMKAHQIAIRQEEVKQKIARAKRVNESKPKPKLMHKGPSKLHRLNVKLGKKLQKYASHASKSNKVFFKGVKGPTSSKSSGYSAHFASLSDGFALTKHKKKKRKITLGEGWF